MKYHVSFLESVEKTLSKYDRYTQKILLKWIEEHLENSENPRIYGKPLSQNRAGQWRYRVGDYRIIALIKDNELVILVIAIGHRKDIYS